MFLSIVWDVHPEIFQVGPIILRWYPLMFIIAFLLGLKIFKNMVISEGKPIELYETILTPVFLGTLFGARIGHCLFYERAYYLAHPLEIIIPFRDGHFQGFAGLASHGAAIGIIFALYLYSRKHKISFLWTLDRIGITVALSGFFIRIGNLMNSEIYGHATDLPWGFIFARVGETIPKHPTQLYEALTYLTAFVILYSIYLYRKPRFKDGVLFGLFLILVFGGRFVIEFIKEVQVGFERDMSLNMGQWLSLPLIFIGIILLLPIRKE